jgi:phospholipase/carboxylesterase
VNFSGAAREGLLRAKPGDPKEIGVEGLHPLGLGDSRDGMLYLPAAASETEHPLILLLHGSGADARDIVGLLRHAADQNACALLVPDSRDYTWDVLLRGFGPDVDFIDRALAYTFARCRIDRSRVAIAGFSDGASYALTLGITNGGLFSHIIAFSPGFMQPPYMEDTPHIYMSHGVEDRVLPIARCSRRILQRLEQLNLNVTYREFPDGHQVPEVIAREAMDWFISSPKLKRESAA